MVDLATPPATVATTSPASRGRVRRRLVRILLAVGWLLAAGVVAFGGAGIVAAVDHAPAPGARPELTWAADQAAQPVLDDAVANLGRVAADVNVLGTMARSARAAVTQRSDVALSAALADGDAALREMQQDQATVRASLGRMPGGTQRMETRFSAATLDRYGRILRALDATQPLADDWSQVSDGSRQAIQVGGLLVQHDQVAGDAVQLGGKGDYARAIARLRDATALLATARQLRDLLSKMTDVTTLSDWLDRSQAMDTALGSLWQAMLDSKGRVTPKVTQALRAVAVARSLLPVDTRYLDVVMAEVAGWFNQAAISIETAKGQLAAAASELGAPAVASVP